MLKMPLIKYVLEFNQNLKFIHPNIEFLNVTGEYADKIIRLGIIYFIFNEISLTSLKASYLTYYEEDELFKYYCSYDRNKNRVYLY